MKNSRKIMGALAAICLPAAMLLSACAAPGAGAGGDDEGVGAGNATTGSSSADGDSGICLLNNCHSDDECGGCQDGRDTCLVGESRCVACDPVTGMGCDDGLSCSPFGICAPEGQTCPTDEHGDPQIVCNQNSDCLACSPMNQVCDTASGKCQACTSDNTDHCLQSDICLSGKCSPKCPGSCTVDADCGQCGGPGNEAHACNSHKCSECSDTVPCAAGLQCVAGSCIPQCGIPGPVSGDCLSDEDCEYCGDANDGGAWQCNKPINSGGPTNHGSCGPAAAGCSDLGNGVAVLPDPWNDYTNLCSNDGDCAGVGIQLNVGELIRDLIGSDELDLGFTSIAIHDANVSYDMSECAALEISNNISCGICVPCQVDSDCEPIAIDPLISDLFAGDPLVQIAGSLLIDLLYGDNPDHNLNFHCLPVAAGYGVCAPCANPMQECGNNQGGGGGGGGGSCDHSPCSTGGALDASCDSCAATVCQADSYCCNNSWDDVCVDEAAQMCGSTCNGGGGGCAHNVCSAGDALDPGCSSCAASVCQADSYCCTSQWDSICVGMVPQYCGGDACGGGGGGGGCAHDECGSGQALDPSCSSCATSVCNQDSYCCDVEWDSICADMAQSLCGC